EDALAALAELDGPASAGMRVLIHAAAGRHAEFAAALAALEPDLSLHAELARRLEEAGAGPEAVEVMSTLLSRLEAGEEPAGEVAARLPLPAAVLVRDDLASIQARLGRPADAAATLEPLIGHPEPAVATGARLRAADFLHQAGETERALALLPAGEGGAEADLMTLDALFEEGDEPAATRLLRRLGQSDEPRTVLRAAGVAQSHERHDLALPLLEALAESDPAPDALFQLGAAYERSGRIEEAVGTFRRLLAAEPELDEAANYLGYLWAERGENLDEALELVRRAVAAEPDNAAYLDSLGWVHHRLGEHELALGYLERAANLMPGDPEVLEHLGDVQRAIGDAAAARESYQRAIAAGGGEDVEELRRKVAELARSGAAAE
ncbi:MAG TPA: tetratricopeptide repeat protein, partial [Thermoanaerobaculia bacterium]|nr:tetratricopeptide repeat protein [Thermoanaerobaculia bacterium]